MMNARRRHFGLPTLGASLCLAAALVIFGAPSAAPASQVGTVSRGAIKRAEYARKREIADSVDRRPIRFVRIWNGSYEPGNPLGLAPAYRDDSQGPAEIIKAIDEAYDEGWRRIVLHLPTGAPQQAVLNRTIEEWWRRAPQWRSSMRRELRAWKLEHPDASLGVYMGLRQRNDSQPTLGWMSRCLWPLVDAGFDLFVFDASSAPSTRPTFIAAQSWLRGQGAKAVMEAYPLDRTTQGRPLETEFLEGTPMFALLAFVDRQDPDRQWRFDPEMTEVWVGVGRDEPIDAQVVADFIDRGFVPVVYSLSVEERALVLALYESER